MPPPPPSAPVTAPTAPDSTWPGSPSDVWIAPAPPAATVTEPSGDVPVATNPTDTLFVGGLTITCGIGSASRAPAIAEPEASTPNTVATDSATPVNFKLCPIFIVPISVGTTLIKHGTDCTKCANSKNGIDSSAY